MTRVSVTLEYPGATAEQVATMLLTPAFREAVCAAHKHALGATATVDGTSVVVDQRQSVGRIPGFAKKFVGDELRIVQQEQWSGLIGTISVTIPGKPGKITGTAQLQSSTDGVREVVDLDVEVGIPLVGGKIAGLLAEQLSEALEIEQAVGLRWLAGERP
ncbi:DUF2505 domain-containing protein [Nocardioides dubius]|uniref:DUF2505 domain-containing protein n=1 Tax=Nocardioides dubius TaxID=317019 RepID=A0ABN1TLR5_9ACTN